jgi:nitrogen fixation protein FixH
MTRLVQHLSREGRWIPLIFVAFFLVVFAVNGAMVTVALSTWTGVTTETHYRDGVEYNKRLAAAERQDAMGWNVGVEAKELAPRRLDFSVGVAGPDGQALYPDTIEVVFWRPTTEGFDRTERLRRGADGRYAAIVELPKPGLWDARVTIRHGDRRFQTVKRIFLER